MHTTPCSSSRLAARIAVAGVACALLAGCSTTTAGPSTSSSSPAAATPPSGSPAASSTPPGGGSERPSAGAADAERYAAILPAFRAYWAAIDDLHARGGEGAPTQAMKDSMSDRELAQWVKDAAEWVRLQRVYTGKNVILDASVTKSAFAPDSATAEVAECVDAGGVMARDPKGDIPRKAGTVLRGTAYLVWSDGHWRVDGHSSDSVWGSSC